MVRRTHRSIEPKRIHRTINSNQPVITVTGNHQFPMPRLRGKSGQCVDFVQCFVKLHNVQFQPFAVFVSKDNKKPVLSIPDKGPDLPVMTSELCFGTGMRFNKQALPQSDVLSIEYECQSRAGAGSFLSGHLHFGNLFGHALFIPDRYDV